MTRAETHTASAGKTVRGLASLLSVLMLIALWPVQSFAQSNVDGSVYGQAKPGTQVSIEGAETGFRTSTTVDDQGSFRFPAVPRGKYKIVNEGVTEEITVRIGEGTSVRFTTAAAGDSATQLETLEVTGANVSAVDIAQVETSFNIGEAQFDSIPVPRNVTGIALLAPGTIKGDNGFGDLASFGGSTVSENQYYLNGFNISDLRTRLGPSTVPFEFFKEFQIKTGGYSAEFGRSTGGVVNAVSKRGTNMWETGISYVWEPRQLREAKPDGYNMTPGANFGTPFYVYSQDERERKTLNLELGGPVIQDKLFFYVLGSLAETTLTQVDRQTRLSRDFRKGDTSSDRTSDDPFGALKIDWQIAENHNFEYTGFVDRSDQERLNFNYTVAQASRSDFTGKSVLETGGETSIFRYSGIFFDDWKLSALYGLGDTDSTLLPDPDSLVCPRIDDTRAVATQTRVGCFVANPIYGYDKREAVRVDLEWNIGQVGLGSHIVRVGIDREENESYDNTNVSGGAVYSVHDVAAGDNIGVATTGPAAPAPGEYVEVQQFSAGGTFREYLNAYYIEDNWQLFDSMMVSLGLRAESFEDGRADGGGSYIELDGDIAPRFGYSWDFMETGRSKIYANYGRYYIPIGTQATVRNQGGEFNQYTYWEFNGYSADRTRTPILGAQIGGPNTFADGTSKDPLTLVDQTAKPSYQDEYILGLQTELPEFMGSNSSGGIRYVFRKLGRTLEDIAVDSGLNALLNGSPEANPQDCDSDGVDDDFACGFDFYFITNPGSDVTVYLPTDATTGNYDHDGTGPLRPITIPNALMGYAEPQRKYHAVELTYERFYDRKWFLQGSYTWSQSYGNYEGFVNSSIEQADVAITQDFDQPGFNDHAYGYLANDRRHKFKVFGAYNLFGEQLRLGGNLLYQTGRPINGYGVHPTDPFAAAYGSFSFYHQGQPSPRGSWGRTPTTWSMDLSLKFTPAIWDSKVSASVDVFNLLNNDKAVEVNERADTATGAVNPNFLNPTDFQDPRFFRFMFEYKL